jgi:hypothetical protein
LSYLLLNLPPWNRDLLEQLIGSQTSKTFPTLYEPYSLLPSSRQLTTGSIPKPD